MRVPIAELVRRLAANGGPCPPGSRANTNKGASRVSRALSPGAMARVTVASAFDAGPPTVAAIAEPAPAAVPAAPEAIPGAVAPEPAVAVASVPSSAIRASSICSIWAGGCSALRACQRASAAALSPRAAAANPAYSKAFGLSGASFSACSNSSRRRRRDVAAGTQTHGLAQPQCRVRVAGIELMSMVVGQYGVIQPFEHQVRSPEHQPAGDVLRVVAQTALELRDHGKHIGCGRRRVRGRVPVPVGP